jgi:hypothetical protein
MIKEARRYTTTPGFAVQVSVVYSEEPVPMLWLPEKNRYWGPLLGFGARSIKLLHRSASYQCRDSRIADGAYSDRRSWTCRCRSPLAQKLRQVRIDTGRPPDSCLAACTGRARPGDWRHPLAGDCLADQRPSAREFPGLIPPVGQRCVVSLPDTTVAAPTTAGIGHGRRRAQAEASLAEQGFDRANERLRVGEVVHGQGKRIGTGVRVGHHGCGWIWGGYGVDSGCRRVCGRPPFRRSWFKDATIHRGTDGRQHRIPARRPCCTSQGTFSQG